jgi:hypothetical protein
MVLFSFRMRRIVCMSDMHEDLLRRTQTNQKHCQRQQAGTSLSPGAVRT